MRLCECASAGRCGVSPQGGRRVLRSNSGVVGIPPDKKWTLPATCDGKAHVRAKEEQNVKKK